MEYRKQYGRKKRESKKRVGSTRNRKKGRETKWREMFLPTSLLQPQRAKEDKTHTKGSGAGQPSDHGLYCTPRGGGAAGGSDCGGRREAGRRERYKAVS